MSPYAIATCNRASTSTTFPPDGRRGEKRKKGRKKKISKRGRKALQSNGFPPVRPEIFLRFRGNSRLARWIKFLDERGYRVYLSWKFETKPEDARTLIPDARKRVENTFVASLI